MRFFQSFVCRSFQYINRHLKMSFLLFDLNHTIKECAHFREVTILGDPGAVSRAGREGATKVFKYKRKSPWVPTLTGPFPNGQANAGS